MKVNTSDLRRFELRQSDDEVKTDLEVVCTVCGEVLCDAEHEDTLGSLTAMAEDHDCPKTPNFGFPETYPDWRAPQDIVLGDYVETDIHHHRGRVFQVHPGYPAGLGCPESDAWLAGQQPVPLTEYKYARWVSILVHEGGSVVVPSDLAHRVEPFDLENRYTNQYFRSTVESTEAGTKPTYRVTATIAFDYDPADGLVKDAEEARQDVVDMISSGDLTPGQYEITVIKNNG